MIIEIVDGYLANSISIVSDAVHLLSSIYVACESVLFIGLDIAGFSTSVAAIIFSKKSANMKYTFGFKGLKLWVHCRLWSLFG